MPRSIAQSGAAESVVLYSVARKEVVGNVITVIIANRAFHSVRSADDALHSRLFCYPLGVHWGYRKAMLIPSFVF